ncbi:unnamed protein product [Phaedon cochleariae]|uniref:Uncharacterized protein n=1 Tax=Phaedon cochleariae TaxID=80249 RepID=A0A9P0DRW7_PHACE|nr:unnamed protein product [Phaedon cochleariae]
MAQAFITTYTNNFRWNVQERVKPIDPTKDNPDCDVDKDLWITYGDNVDEEDTEHFAKVANTVKQMQLKRMKTTYQTEYCKDLSKKQVQMDHQTIDTKSFENQLLESSKILYGRRNQRLPKPLPSSKRINGYLRPQRLFTPLTFYQHDIGRVGFNILLKQL